MKTARALSEDKTIERFEKRENWRSKQGYGATAEFGAGAPKLLPRLADYIRGRLNKRDELTLMLRGIGPDKLALAGLASLMHWAVIGRNDEPGRTIDLGKTIQGELWAAQLLKDNRALLGKIGKIPNPRDRLRAAKMAGFRSKDWTEKQKLKAGNWLLDCCLQALPDVFVMLPDGVIDVRDEARDWIVALRERVMWSDPVIVPCLEPPKPWTGWRDGGYWDERTRLSVSFVKTRYKDTERDIRRAFADGSMKQHVDGVNSLQAVPYRINDRALEAVKLYAHRLREAGKLKACEALLNEDIRTAERLRGTPFYVPLNCDFRGRFNGIPHFNFYREDHVRALFMFDRGQTLGDKYKSSLRWLRVHTATCFGLDGIDKQSFAAREFWAIANRDLIERTARLESKEWLEADAPFAFYAACLELTAAWKDGPDHVTHLPISFDATCSGLQHLCAMTRAEEGELVNLRWTGDFQGFFATCFGLRQSEEGGALWWTGGIPGLIPPQDDQSADAQDLQVVVGLTRPPQDIYAVVARKVRALVKDDTELRDSKIDREIDRKLVKRPVMTYGYSSQQFGMKEQIKEVLAERGQELDWKALWRLAGYVFQTIEGIIPKAREVREILRGYVQVLAKEGEPLQWTTPTGFPLANRYCNSKTERVHLILQGTRVQRTTADGHEPGILSKDAMDGIVPNVVHSLDAAHLLRTVNVCVAAGIKDILVIHDCFACLAPKAEEFNAIIRREFVRMYEEHDPLNEIRERALCSLGPLAPQLLPAVPERGSLNLSEFSRSVYAFS
jgi:DNA-directed RNA polymerase, mitochondrial